MVEDKQSRQSASSEKVNVTVAASERTFSEVRAGSVRVASWRA
jgi:hypothetical protein